MSTEETKRAERILFVTTHNPWGTGGGCFATRLYLSAIREIFDEGVIDICLYDRFEKDVPKEWMDDKRNRFHFARQRSMTDRVLSVFNGIMHRYQKVVKQLIDRNRYDICILDKSQTAASIIRMLRRSRETVKVTVHHNCEADYFKQEQISKLMRMVYLPHVKRFERVAYRESDINLFLSGDDLKQLKAKYGTGSGHNVVSGIFAESDRNVSYKPDGEIKTQRNIMITGSLNNSQNTEGIVKFFKGIYRLLPSDYRIIIAGQNPTEIVKQHCDGKGNVELIANPEDMSEIVRRGDVFVCPTDSGSGIKIRILDGLRAGLPVIAHKVSARGYGDITEAGAMMEYETPEEFISALKELERRLDNNELNSRMITALYNRVFSHRAGIEKLKNALLP